MTRHYPGTTLLNLPLFALLSFVTRGISAKLPMREVSIQVGMVSSAAGAIACSKKMEHWPFARKNKWTDEAHCTYQVSAGRLCSFWRLLNICSGVPSKSLPQPRLKRVSPVYSIPVLQLSFSRPQNLWRKSDAGPKPYRKEKDKPYLPICLKLNQPHIA